MVIGFVGYVLVECGMVGSGFGELWLWGWWIGVVGGVLGFEFVVGCSV